MKTCFSLALVLMVVNLCSCATDKSVPLSSPDGIADALSTTPGPVKFVPLCEVIGPQTDKLISLLKSKGVTAHNVGGSEFYSITVPENQLSRARELLQKNDVKKKYELIMPKQ